MTVMGGTTRALVAVAFVLTGTAPASAKPPTAPAATTARPKSLSDTLTGQAKADYESARLLVRDGDYAGALVKLQAAYGVSHDARLLWNVAACEKQLRHYAKAIDIVRRYAAEGAGLTAQDKSEAAELIRTLEPFTVTLTLEVNEPDASVEIDDVPIGKTPLPSPVVVDIGNRRVRVHKEGFTDYAATTSFGDSPRQTIPVKLEKEVHEGKLAVQVPAGASIFIDGVAIPPGTATEPAEVKLTSGGGHTLRVTAKGMRVYEREVVVKDKETRVVEVHLEREAEPDKPTLRVAVGCIDATPRTVDDGLAVYIDGSPAAATANGGKKTWNATLGRDVLEHVGFSVARGGHTVLVRIPGCDPMEATVEVPDGGADLRGALRSESPLLVRGPAGNPNGGRIAVALWLPNGITKFRGTKFASDAQPVLDGLRYKPSAVGISLQPGLAFRWWTLMLDLGYAKGTTTVEEPPNLATPEVLAAVQGPKVSWLRAGLRVGARFPFHLAALSLGAGAGVDNIVLSNLPKGVYWDRPLSPYLSGWSMVDVYPMCDVAIFAAFGIDYQPSFEAGSLGLQFGAAFHPNTRCRAERATNYGLSSSLAPQAGDR